MTLEKQSSSGSTSISDDKKTQINDSFESCKDEDKSLLGKRKLNGLSKLAVDLDRNLKIHSTLSTLSSTSKRSKLSSESSSLSSSGVPSSSISGLSDI